MVPGECQIEMRAREENNKDGVEKVGAGGRVQEGEWGGYLKNGLGWTWDDTTLLESGERSVACLEKDIGVETGAPATSGNIFVYELDQ